MSELTQMQLRALAFSGLSHAAECVDDLANARIMEPPEHLLRAIFTHRQNSVAEVFEPLSDYRQGIASTCDLLSGRLQAPQQARYIAQLLKLAELLRRNRAMVERLRKLLDQAADTGATWEAAADIYKETISRLGERIQVTGIGDRLQHPETANHIRALLLAGIRFAWAWQQLGGRQWHLLLQRRALHDTLAAMVTT
ncbi:MAG: DUF489 family protein [Pseudomonadales bacterium]|nr:DUF489 family protein [Pseudomonadales bacterium]MCP5185732.1 DUF489 family protein [Pseudomonadales bacterium]